MDKPLIIKHAHLRKVMAEYIHYSNTARPYQGIHQHMPDPPNVKHDN